MSLSQRSSDDSAASKSEIADIIDRLERLEQSRINPEASSARADRDEQPFEAWHGLNVGSGAGADPSSATGDSRDIQGEFSALRDSLQNIKLPAELRLNDGNKQGLKRQDHPLANVLIKCARFTEANFKILSQCETTGDRDMDKKIESLFKVCLAQMKYIQDEFAGILVQGTFDPITSRMFKSLQRQNSVLSAEHIGILQSAATISAAAHTPRDGGQDRGDRRFGFGNRGYSRGRGERRGFSRGFPGYRQDNFQRLSRSVGPPAANNSSQFDPQSQD